MSDTVYLELNEDVGLAPPFIHDENGLIVPNPRAGEPEPLNNIGITIPIPTMVGDDVVTTTSRVAVEPGDELDELLRARIIPGTRIVETDHPAVVNVLLSTEHYHQVDPPRSEQPRKPRRGADSIPTPPAAEED